jgi:hypothetical protein
VERRPVLGVQGAPAAVSGLPASPEVGAPSQPNQGKRRRRRRRGGRGGGGGSPPG